MNSYNTKLELTAKALILGIMLSIILSAANAYLGLFAGMTVSASIPAAVISMAILKIFKNSSILENNLVQTAASAGESLAAGVIFTVPALLLIGYWQDFNYFEVAKISALGGLIGVLFTIPLRRTLILQLKLLFPEGIATAEVLKLGHNSSSDKKTKKGIKLLLLGSIAGGTTKIAQQGLSLWASSIEYIKSFGNSIFGIGCNLSPALLSVGYIVGWNISILVFLGGFLSWFIAIPIYSYIYPSENLDITLTAWTIWNTKIRYLGVGAMVVGGVWSLIKITIPVIDGIKSSLMQTEGYETSIEEQDFSIKYVVIMLAALIIPLFYLYFNIIQNIGLAILLSIIMLLFGFLFSAVASYMAGIVGSSNNPISGVTIATILFSSVLLLMLIGPDSATKGAASAILIGSVVCCAAAIGGDNLQDLKTGYIIGATPWKQQIMQIVGTLSAAVTIGIVLNILHSAYTIGSDNLSAPQATLMKSVAEGVFSGNLPWNMVLFGAFIGLFIIVIDIIQEKRKSTFRLPVLAVAVGIYLPIELSTPILIGGLISYLTKNKNNNGLLFASGLITGEALMGIMVALPIFLTGNKSWWQIINFSNTNFHQWIGLLPFIIIIAGFSIITSNKK